MRPPRPSQRRSIRRSAPSASRSGDSVNRALGAELGLGADEQRRDVVVAARRAQAAVDDAIAQRLEAVAAAPPAREQAPQPDVDALAAALDEAVRVEDDRGAGREVDDGLRVHRQVADAERRRDALEQRGVPWAGKSSGGGCPALTNRSRPRSGSITA